MCYLKGEFEDQSVQSALLGRYLRFGQMVCLSDDGFVEDMHIGTIVERDDVTMVGFLEI